MQGNKNSRTSSISGYPNLFVGKIIEIVLWCYAGNDIDIFLHHCSCLCFPAMFSSCFSITVIPHARSSPKTIFSPLCISGCVCWGGPIISDWCWQNKRRNNHSSESVLMYSPMWTTEKLSILCQMFLAQSCWTLLSLYTSHLANEMVNLKDHSDYQWRSSSSGPGDFGKLLKLSHTIFSLSEDLISP